MAQLVTLEEVVSSLKLDPNEEGHNLLLLIEDASGLVLDHLKSRGAYLVGEDGEVPPGTRVPGAIRRATIFLVGEMHRAPDNDVEAAWARGNLPDPVVSMLRPHRDPALA